MTKTIKKDNPVQEIVVENETSKEIIAQPHEVVNGFDIQSIITHAIDQKIPVETLERLLTMAKEMQAIKAKQEFDKAMSGFQAECPTITKTKEVKTKSGIVAYRYAPIESIVEQVRGVLDKYGFSYSSDMEVLPEGVKVTLKVTHIMGHTQTNSMQVPLGTKTDIMSQSQVVAAAQTFAKRYAFCNAFGIMTGDEDTDARPQEKDVEYNYQAQIQKPFDDTKVLELIRTDLSACNTAEEYALRSSDIKIARQNKKLSDASFEIVKKACGETVKRIQEIIEVNKLEAKLVVETEPETEASKLMKQGMAKAKARIG